MNKSQFTETICESLLQFVDANNLVCIWPDKDAKIPNGQESWLRVSIRHATGGQSSLSNQNGVRRFTYTGTLTVQVFTPKGEVETSAALCDKVMGWFTSFRDPSIWLRGTHYVDSGRSGDFNQVNVLATFSYDFVG